MLTQSQIDKLKAGDIVKDLTDKGKEITISNFSLSSYDGKPIIYIMVNGNELGLPYFYDELELLRPSGGKCVCDFYKVILPYGCKCNGS